MISFLIFAIFITIRYFERKTTQNLCVDHLETREQGPSVLTMEIYAVKVIGEGAVLG